MPLFAAKGFGNTPPPSPKKSKATTTTSPSASSPVAPSSPSMSTDDRSLVDNIQQLQQHEQQKPAMSQGKAALDKLRRERAEQRNEEIRKMKEVQDIDDMLRESPEAAAIPEKVAQRMGRRMLPFVGIPLFGAMGSFVGFWYMATYKDMEFQPVLVAGTSLALLAVGLVGITYSIFSSSWDADREGSLLGTDEFSQNLGNIKAGLSRSRENAILRDKMDRSVYSPEDLAQIDAANNKPKEPKKSFTEKLGDEME
mmetsp:Transcript_19323/g.46691  ORF Transcript_19323/g.46691 Transcript_19323/m.46691 type:complete len:254 (+) Transcript_19323:259-1020(+)